MFYRFTVESRAAEELVDITEKVSHFVRESLVQNGVCVIYTPHTTAAVTINENADPSVRRDILKGLDALNLSKVRFEHGEGNSPAHIKSSLIGCSETVIIRDGRLTIGTWQGVFLCEFDGPRSREVYVTIMG